jgi:hypothetical protein
MEINEAGGGSDLPIESPLGYTGGVWPPPPQSNSSLPDGPAFRFKYLYLTIRKRRDDVGKICKKNISDYREGFVRFDSDALHIEGLVVPAAEVRVPILVVTLVLSLCICVIANLVMEYGFRSLRISRFAWQNVHRVVLDSKKKQVGILFEWANQKGIKKSYTLCFRLSDQVLPEFRAAAEAHVPGRVLEDKLASGTSPIVIAFLVIFIVGLIGLMAYGLSVHH